MAAGVSCSSQTRTCFNGVLSGSYAFKDCEVSQALSCTFDGQTINDGQSVTAYQFETVAIGGICSSQTHTCNNGVLSGNFNFESCTVESVTIETQNLNWESTGISGPQLQDHTAVVFDNKIWAIGGIYGPNDNSGGAVYKRLRSDSQKVSPKQTID